MKINQSMFDKFIYIALTVDVDPDPSNNDSKVFQVGQDLKMDQF